VAAVPWQWRAKTDCSVVSLYTIIHSDCYSPHSNLACFHYRPLVDIVFWICNILEPSGRKSEGGPSPSPKIGGPDPPSPLKLRLWVWGGVVPLPRKFEFFISKWCGIVHSGCVVFNIHVSHGLYLIEVPVCA